MRVSGLIRSRKGSWPLEIGLACVAATVGFFFLLTTVDQYPETAKMPPLITELLAGIGSGTALVLFRRRRPVGLTLAMIPFGIVFATPMGATMVALFTVAVRRPWRVTLAVAAVHASAVITVYRLAIEDDRRYWESMLTIVLLHVALVAIGMLVRSQRLLVRSLRERARQAEEGQRLRVEEARHLERERLAREMHDVLAHRISLLAVHAGALEVRRDASGEERQAAGVIRQCAYDALEDLRQVIGVLRDRPDDPVGRPAELGNGDEPPERPQPTLADLPELVDQASRAGARVTVDNQVADLAGVPAGIGRHAYRIIQEGLTNARKHAAGAPVRVSLTASPGAGLAIEISNPLPVPAAFGGTGAARDTGAAGGTEGTDGIPGAGAGLIGLRERVALVGGSLEHGPTPDDQFRLRAWLPWRP